MLICLLPASDNTIYHFHCCFHRSTSDVFSTHIHRELLAFHFHDGDTGVYLFCEGSITRLPYICSLSSLHASQVSSRREYLSWQVWDSVIDASPGLLLQAQERQALLSPLCSDSAENSESGRHNSFQERQEAAVQLPLLFVAEKWEAEAGEAV